MKFSQYPISEEIKNNLISMGMVKPTDIQYKAIPSILKGEDVLAVAQTGTGKTAAFAIPVIDKINSLKKNKRSYGIKCIVMVPTRELAMQIETVFNKIAAKTKVKIFALYGGVEQDYQVKKLQDGIDILITTPGRMFDLIHQKFINLDKISTLILDEADHMLQLGFIEDIKFIKKLITNKHQTLFFSATISPEIKKLAFSQVKSSAIRIQISPKDPVSKNVLHYVIFVGIDEKRFFLEHIIKNNPNSKIIVFVRTRVRAERIANAMKRVNIPVLTLHGEKDQKDRSEVMDQFRNGLCRVMLATDVSARGIDIPDIEYVINYDFPEQNENYVHRIGRTGRGFNKGIAVTFVTAEEKERLTSLQEFLTKPIEEIKLSKKDYKFIITPIEESDNWEKLIEEEELKEKEKKIKKKRKK